MNGTEFDQESSQRYQKFKEVTLQSDVLFRGKIIDLAVERVSLPNGQESSRERVFHPGAVAVIGLQQRKMALVEQFRNALQRSALEIPAGKLEQGEDPAEAAMREFAEETGWRCEQVERLYSCYTSPGFADEIVHIYKATKLVGGGEPHPDEDEFVELHWLTLDEMSQAVAKGWICDAKTLLAWQWWMLQVDSE